MRFLMCTKVCVEQKSDNIVQKPFTASCIGVISYQFRSDCSFSYMPKFCCMFNKHTKCNDDDINIVYIIIIAFWCRCRSYILLIEKLVCNGLLASAPFIRLRDFIQPKNCACVCVLSVTLENCKKYIMNDSFNVVTSLMIGLATGGTWLIFWKWSILRPRRNGPPRLL